MANGYFQQWSPGDSIPDDFLQLPNVIYQHDPLWPGEIADQIRQQFSALNPWFATGTAWLGVIPGKTRLAGFFQHKVIDGQPAAFFGFWETVDDLAANQVIFNQFIRWAKAQGAKHIYGPINFSTFGSYRIRLNAFEYGAFPDEPYNPDYYLRLLEQLGLTIRLRYYSSFGITKEVESVAKERYLRAQHLASTSLSPEVVPLTPELWINHLDEFYQLIDESFAANFAYTSVSQDTFQQHAPAMADRFCPHTSIILQTPEREIAGFLIGVPNYGVLQRHQLQPVKFNARQDWHRLPDPRTILIKTLAIHPRFRPSHLYTLLYYSAVKRAVPHYQQFGMVLMNQGNNTYQTSRKIIKNRREHCYGLFEKSLQS